MRERKRIGLRDIAKLEPNQTIWDAAVAGFHARRQHGPGVTYAVFYRINGRQRFYTIGRHGSPWTPDEARSKANEILGDVARGFDPTSQKLAARKAPIVAELCDRYLADVEAGRLLTRRGTSKKASTVSTDRGRIERHIKPLLGGLRVSAVDRTDIERFMNAVAEGETAAKVKTRKRGLARVSGGRGAATRTVGLLGGIFSYAVRHRMRADNPVHGVTRFADGRRDRRLSDDEYAALGAALRRGEDKGIWPPAIAAARFLALTGWRKGEALALGWNEIDRRTATLADSKTGRSIRPLSNAACDVLRSLPRVGGVELVFMATRGSGQMSGFPGFWRRIAKLGGLSSDISPHVLRHSFASLAGDLGYSESTIGALIGHKGAAITSRYVHIADAVLLAAADAVANRTAELMGEPRSSADIVPLVRAGG